ncbi:MAG: glycosyltransferase [Propionibacteriaceae bacterium]|nr:glycosyltransferase [Propionibacteriaceae bacterium]
MLKQYPPDNRVLQYSYGGRFLSGIDTYLLEAYRALDHDRVQFDFLFRYENPLGPVTKELGASGARVYSLDVPEQANPLVRHFLEIPRLWAFLKTHRYRVVEINMSSLFICLQCAFMAMVFGAKVRIVHSHDAVASEAVYKHLLKRAFTPLLDVVGNEFWAGSSDSTAQYLFTRRTFEQHRYTVVRNGIDAAKFAYDPVARAELRAQLGLGDSLVVGQVGRFTKQKNHRFSLLVFRELLRTNPDAKLLLVGDGVTFASTRELCSQLGLDDSVTFLGARDDVPRLLSAIDVIIAPSRHEGFAMGSLEWQCSGLPCLVSDAFPREVDITGRVKFMALDEPLTEWAAALAAPSTKDRSTGADEVRAAGYDRQTTAEWLQRRYAELFARQGLAA